MNRLVARWFLMVIIIWLCVCPGLIDPVLARENQGTVQIGWQDNKKAIRLAEGQVLQVTLSTKSGTGYRWQFVTEPAGRVLKFITHYEEPTSNLLGSPLQEHWFFNAVRAGETAIDLAYARSWESSAIKQFSVKVVIK